jgi:hypothetical protein
MKYILALVLVIGLSGCNNDSSLNNEGPSSPSAIDASQAGSTPIDPQSISRLGEVCGPASEKFCGSGLSCQFEGLQQNAGKCLPIIVNPEIECEDNQAPVCGLIGNNKNGYLNECFARRFGAIVLNEGLCKPDETIVGNCNARAYSLGNCQDSFSGARFNSDNNQCETVTLVGCEADIPFETIESCNQACS